MRVIQALKKCILCAHNSTIPSASVRIRHASVVAQNVGEDKIKEQHPTKKPRRPFVKDLFVGKFDTDMLTFPEIPALDQVNELEKSVLPLEQYIKEVDSAEIEISSVSKKIIEDLKSLGAFGLLVPKLYGGSGLTSLEYARFTELLCLDGSIGVMLTAHQLFGTMGILIAGTEKQKQQYLPRLASGEWIGAFCLSEEGCGSDASYVQTEATLSDDGKTWHIKGRKTWISNGDLADIFTVIAKTEVIEFGGSKASKLTAFLVERNFGGISISKSNVTIGAHGTRFCEISFDSTPVPVENVLGEVGHGFKLAMDILGSGRFSTGSSFSGVLRNVLNKTTAYAINRKQFGKYLLDFEMVQQKVADVAKSIYTMESMTYLTSGILDNAENPDVAVESSIVKVSSSEKLLEGITKCHSILGGASLLKDNPHERVLRDSSVLNLLYGTNDVLRIFIALSGLHHAGLVINEEVEKVRNPLMHPGFIMKKMLNWRNLVRQPKLVMGLDGFVHPSLQIAAQQLEYSVLHLQFAVEILLGRYGQKITENQIEMNRLTDIAILIYEMTAVIARASRSYCIGLRHSSSEVLMALTIAYEAFQTVNAKVREIKESPYITSDTNVKKIAKEIFKHKGYFPVHPLSRNF